MDKQYYFGDTERQAIAILILKMVVADKICSPEELHTLRILRDKYAIPYQLPDNCMGYEEAIATLRSMSQEKQQEVRNMMVDLSHSDNNPQKDEPAWAVKEQAYSDLLFKQINLEKHLYQLKDTLIATLKLGWEPHNIRVHMNKSDMKKIMNKLDVKAPFRLGSELHRHLTDIYPLCSISNPEALFKQLDEVLKNKELEDQLDKASKLANDITLLERLNGSNYLDVSNYANLIINSTDNILTQLIETFLQAVKTNNNIK